MMAFALPSDLMQHPLRSISIAGYKSIREATIRLGSLNVLIGANGAGKSNLISAFALLHEVLAKRLAFYVGKRGGADEILYFGRRHTPRLSLTLDFGPNGYELVLSATDKNKLVFQSEAVWYHRPGHPQPSRDNLASSGDAESALADRAGIAHHVSDSIASWRVFHFHDTGESAEVKQQHNIDDNRALYANAANLAAFLYRLRHTAPQSYAQIVATVRSVAPSFEDFHLEPDSLNARRITLEWRAHDSDRIFNAHALSDGTLRFVCLATLLLQPDLPTTVLVDEPELGLHPSAIHKLAALLQSAATRTQVIVSTQSVTLMNQFAVGDLIVVDHDGVQSTFRRVDELEIAEWLEEYALGEIWEKNLIGGRP